MGRRIFHNSVLLTGRLILVFVLFNLQSGCESSQVKEVTIGYIGPLTTRATDLGIGPANAMQLAVDQYNADRQDNEPKATLFVEDDRWEKEKAIPAYEKLRMEHDIDLLFISNTDGTIAVQDKLLEDGVIAVNPLNSDALLSTMNKNTFRIAKTTEEANGLIAIRIIELGLKKVLILHYPNDFMTRASNAVKALLDEAQIENKLVTAEIGETNFSDSLKTYQEESYDAYVFFGYKEFGFAMKQARDLGIAAPFFGSTVLLDPAYFENSEGAVVGTECTFFTESDGNYVLTNKFLSAYNDSFGSKPASIWPPMQAYDAINLVLNEVRAANHSKRATIPFADWLRTRLLDVRHFQGVCGNLSIASDGSSKGIYFSLYRYESQGKLLKVKR